MRFVQASSERTDVHTIEQTCSGRDRLARAPAFYRLNNKFSSRSARERGTD